MVLNVSSFSVAGPNWRLSLRRSVLLSILILTCYSTVCPGQSPSSFQPVSNSSPRQPLDAAGGIFYSNKLQWWCWYQRARLMSGVFAIREVMLRFRCQWACGFAKAKKQAMMSAYYRLPGVMQYVTGPCSKTHVQKTSEGCMACTQSIGQGTYICPVKAVIIFSPSVIDAHAVAIYLLWNGTVLFTILSSNLYFDLSEVKLFTVYQHLTHLCLSLCRLHWLSVHKINTKYITTVCRFQIYLRENILLCKMPLHFFSYENCIVMICHDNYLCIFP